MLIKGYFVAGSTVVESPYQLPSEVVVEVVVLTPSKTVSLLEVLLRIPKTRANTIKAIANNVVALLIKEEVPEPKVESLDPPKIPPSPTEFSSCTATRNTKSKQTITNKTNRIMLKTPISFPPYFSKAIIGRNFSTESEAPPTKAPSIFFLAIKAFTLSALTEPPYCIINFSAISLPYNFSTSERINA